MIITIVDSNISLVVAVVAVVVVVLVFVVVFVIAVVMVVVVITWWLGNLRMVFFVGIDGVVSVVGNAIFSHVGVVSFVVAFVVGEMMASAATTSRREVDEQRKCGPLAT
jgi:hypothetical protein